MATSIIVRPQLSNAAESKALETEQILYINNTALIIVQNEK